VVLFVAILDVLEDLDGLLRGGGVDDDLLKAPVERAVLLDVLPILVERRGADALDFATSKGGLEHVRGIERAGSTTCADDRVELVDEQNDVRTLLEFVHDRLHALLELAAVLGAGHQSGEVERDDAFVVKHTAHRALDDAHGQAFSDSRLADTGLADEDRVVLLPAAQHLRDALDFALAPDDGVQLAFFGKLGQVTAEVVEYRCFALFHFTALLANSG
jgi:hypothetical protein